VAHDERTIDLWSPGALPDHDDGLWTIRHSSELPGEILIHRLFGLGYLAAMTDLCAQIPKFSTEEKLIAMEALWASLHEHVKASDPPEWHREELRERMQQIQSGTAVYEDWKSVKDELRGLRP
jgi:hypothetical protein